MKIKILLVDDEPKNIELIEALLAPEDYVVEKANNGPQAVSFLNSFQPDLVLLDILMPGMSGYQVLEEIRKNPATGAVPVILLSAFNDKEHVIRGIQAGADDFITKPFDKTELVSRVKTQAGLSVLRRQINEKDKLISVIELVSDAIVITDENYNIMHSNALADGLLKINKFKGNFASFLAEKYGRVIDKNDEKGTFIMEIPAVNTTAMSYISIRFAKSTSKSGKTEAFVFVIRDISEEYGRNRMKRDFISLISDRLRAPLAVINGYSRLIAAHPPEEQLAQLALALVRNAELTEKLAMRMTEFAGMDDIYYADREDGYKGNSISTLDLKQMAETFETVYKKNYELKENSALTDLKKWQKTVLKELIENSFKFSDKEKVVLKVTADKGEICVEDNGPGIEKSEIESVFKPFYSLSKEQQEEYTGTGLGLAVVKRLAESAGNIVELMTPQNGGLRVVIHAAAAPPDTAIDVMN
ncbi:MAG: hypothetical protein CVV21_04875 [Candidatus Goldiibacteriota bacterium HGW-Goldbacteria-1]|jgi:CheY-like chemotaxis protein|nr:MAG: hypothetical protein CVV21_04875 [Candidatus Goldiibacteriota bacterium HGW-Goldbacteria-1]